MTPAWVAKLAGKIANATIKGCPTSTGHYECDEATCAEIILRESGLVELIEAGENLYKRSEETGRFPIARDEFVFARQKFRKGLEGE